MSLNLINKKIERKRREGEMAKGPKRDINMCVVTET